MIKELYDNNKIKTRYNEQSEKYIVEINGGSYIFNNNELKELKKKSITNLVTFLDKTRPGLFSKINDAKVEIKDLQTAIYESLRKTVK